MSVLDDIATGIQDLLEGSIGVAPHTVTVGKFTVVGDDMEWQQDQCSEDPRPVFIEVGDEVDSGEIPTDVSGDYVWSANGINVYIGYAFSPDDDPLERRGVISDDAKEAIDALREPLNWALVTGWSGSDIKRQIQDVRDEDGVIAIQFGVLAITVVYREEW